MNQVKIIRNILVYLSTIIIVSSVYGEPSIFSSSSSSIDNGIKITITGNQFGDFSGEIVSWDDFEDHKLGSYIQNSVDKIGNKWTCIYNYSGPYAEYDNGQTHSGDRAAHIDWTGKSIRAFGWTNRGPYDKLYISYWRYMTGVYTPSEGDNHKQFYLYGNNKQMPQGMPMIPAGNVKWGFYNNVGDGSVPYSERSNINKVGLTYKNTIEKFQRWEWWIELNTPYTAKNGVIKGWVDGKLSINNMSYRHRYVNGEYKDFRLGHMAQKLDDAEAWFDDVYIATTRARVELGNNSDYNSCSHREIQVVSNWSKTNIQFTVNSGSFNDEDSVFFFVIDENGNPSSGYPVTIGEGHIEPATLPNTPANFIIN